MQGNRSGCVGHYKGQLYIIDFTVWLMLVSSLFLLIAHAFDASNASMDRVFGYAILQKTPFYVSEILLSDPEYEGEDLVKLGITSDGRFDAELAKQFLNLCETEHENTRELLGLYHTKNNLDYNIWIEYLNGTEIGSCAHDNRKGLRLNRYVLDTNKEPVIITIEIYKL